jgi:hypothetical protein
MSDNLNQLLTDNIRLKNELRISAHKYSISSKLFNSYKEQYAIAYTRNILMCLTIVILFVKVANIISHIK